jgi:hypothetical protein
VIDKLRQKVNVSRNRTAFYDFFNGQFHRSGHETEKTEDDKTGEYAREEISQRYN